MKKNVLILIVLVVLSTGILGYRYLYHGHRDIASEEPEFVLSVKELHNEFSLNDSLANHTYANQTIAIRGTVTAYDAVNNTITIDEKLAAELVEKPKNPINPGAVIKLKGRFVGYDDLLEELKMDQATVDN